MEHSLKKLKTWECLLTVNFHKESVMVINGVMIHFMSTWLDHGR